MYLFEHLGGYWKTVNSHVHQSLQVCGVLSSFVCVCVCVRVCEGVFRHVNFKAGRTLCADGSGPGDIKVSNEQMPEGLELCNYSDFGHLQIAGTLRSSGPTAKISSCRVSGVGILAFQTSGFGL